MGERGKKTVLPLSLSLLFVFSLELLSWVEQWEWQGAGSHLAAAAAAAAATASISRGDIPPPLPPHCSSFHPQSSVRITVTPSRCCFLASASVSDGCCCCCQQHQRAAEAQQPLYLTDSPLSSSPSSSSPASSSPGSPSRRFLLIGSNDPISGDDVAVSKTISDWPIISRRVLIISKIWHLDFLPLRPPRLQPPPATFRPSCY